jgi:hypothetical protein
VLRTVEWAKVHADSHKDGERSKKIGRAIRDFEAVVPDAKHVRDILVHFDDYERGRGGLQQESLETAKGARARAAARQDEHGWPPLPDIQVPRLNMYYERTDTTYRLHLFGPHVIDVALAVDAAHQLVQDVLDAL